MMGRVKKVTSNHLFLPLFALALLLVFNAFATPGFFAIEFQNGQFYGRIIDILNRASILVILSMGMTFVIATGGIDISQGSVIAISGAICCSLIGGAGDGTANMPLLPACLIAVLVCALCGVWNGFLVSKLKIQPMVATLILLTAGRGIAMLITKGQNVTVYYEPFTYIGTTIPGSPLPTTIFIAALMVLFVVLIQKKTSVGLFVQAVGINANAARRTGLKVSSIIFMVYVFSGICAGIAGLMESSMIAAADPNNAGLNMEMDAILSVALGGTLLSGGKFYIGGSIIGAITIQTMTTTLYALGVSSEQLPVYKALVVILICLLRKIQGCSGEAHSRKGGEAEMKQKSSLKDRLVGSRYFSFGITLSLFVLLYVVGMMNYRGFMKPQVFCNLLIDNAALIIATIGITFVLLIGGIDISIGSVVALTCMSSAQMLQNTGLPAPAVILIVLAMGAVFGLVQGWLITEFNMQPFIVTLAGQFFARGMTAIISRETIVIDNPVYTSLASARIYVLPGGFISVGVVIALVTLVAATLVLKFTRFGRNIYALGGNEMSAQLMGLPTKRTKILAYVVCGFCSALAGVVYSLIMLSGYPLHAVSMEMDAIASSVIGGTLMSGGVAFLPGTLLGVLIQGVIQTFITFQGTLSAWWTRIIIALLLCLFIVIQAVVSRSRQRLNSEH